MFHDHIANMRASFRCFNASWWILNAMRCNLKRVKLIKELCECEFESSFADYYRMDWVIDQFMDSVDPFLCVVILGFSSYIDIFFEKTPSQ